MINHLEQLIALISHEYSLVCETSDDKPEYFEAHQHKSQYRLEMEDAVTFIVIEDDEQFLVYTDSQEPVAILKFDDYELAAEEFLIYAAEIIEA